MRLMLRRFVNGPFHEGSGGFLKIKNYTKFTFLLLKLKGSREITSHKTGVLQEKKEELRVSRVGNPNTYQKWLRYWQVKMIAVIHP